MYWGDFLLPEERSKTRMKEQIAKIKKEALEEIEKVQDLKELNDVKVKYLGK